MNDVTANTPVRTPGRPASPLARQIEKTFELKNQLFADPLISLAEFRLAAGGLSYSAVRRLIASKRISVWRSSPRGHMRIRASEVRRFLDAGFKQQGSML